MDGQVFNRVSYRVLYGDTDKMGVVYYANYLRWFERGRGEFLRQLGIPYLSVEQRNIQFPVIEVSCRYFRSAQYDELVMIETDLLSLARATLSFSYRILRETDSSLLATGSTKHACINSQGRIQRIPADLWSAFESAVASATDAETSRHRG
jgi:acyl-CoA thioester hydrolase